jgi:hypothetical protein
MPSTATWIGLAQVTLGSTSSTVTFSNIPNTYRDLHIIMTASTANGTSSGVGLRLNGDTGSNYHQVGMYTHPSNSGTLSEEAFNVDNFGWGALQPNGINRYDILEYSATDKHKIMWIRRDTPAYVTYANCRWSNNNAVTSITIYTGTPMAIGSTFNLYGVHG